MGWCNVLNYVGKLMRAINEGKSGPSFVITHRGRLEGGTHVCDPFKEKDHSWTKW